MLVQIGTLIEINDKKLDIGGRRWTRERTVRLLGNAYHLATAEATFFST